MLIKSSAALRDDYDSISKLAHETGEPVYITTEGEGDLVVMDIDAYEREKQLEVFRNAIDRAERELQNGEPCMTGNQVRKWLRARSNGV